MEQKVERPSVYRSFYLLIYNGILAFFFYNFAFKNHDSGTCFAKEGNKIGFSVIPVVKMNDAKGKPLNFPEDGYINVTESFHTWFFVGFILSCAGLGWAIMEFISVFTES